MKVHNFSAGPAILPQVVFQEASKAVLDFNNSGLSILEMSHRSKDIVAVADEAVSLVKELLKVPDTHEVLFLSGGASSQFVMTAMNLLGDGDLAGYVDTGTWSAKAIKEAKAFGDIKVLASSKESVYNHIPKDYTMPAGLRYLHYTSNNTIYGTQYQEAPSANCPLVCDMSSDIFSRPVDVSKYDVIYAGAQKNMGPAGVTLVIVNRDALGKVTRHLPSMLDYRVHIAGESMFNTPPVFPIYVSMLTLRWVKEQGGVTAMYQRNKAKAEKLYNEIDTNPLFKGHAVVEDRSHMNVTFTINDKDREEDFNKFCSSRKLDGLKGHRSVGGFRASIYNAMDMDGVDALVSAMREF